MHQDHHLKSCVNQEHERTTLTCVCTLRHQRCVLAFTAARGRADRDVFCRVVKKKRDTCGNWNERCTGTRPASRLFQEHMKGSSQRSTDMQHSRYVTKSITALRRDSLAAIHGRRHPSRKEKPEKLDRLDEVLKQLVVVKVLDRVGPRAS